MKKLWLPLALMVAAFMLAPPAWASAGGSYVVLNGVSTNTDSGWISVSDADVIHVQAWSASTSVVTVNVYCTSRLEAPPFPCVLGGIGNPDSTTGAYYDVPPTMWIKVTTSGWISGSVSVSLETHILR